MNTNNFNASFFGHLALAAGVGIFYHFVVRMLWGFIPFFNPISNSLFQCCTAEPWFMSALNAHDGILNVLLSVPLALFLLNLNRVRVWWLVLAAQLSSFIFWNYHLFYPAVANDLLAQFLPNLIMENVVLPITLALILLLKKSRTKTDKVMGES